MSASPSGASRRTVTVLFCDVVDSTPLGEALDPETLRRTLGAYFDAAQAVLERHGGTVEKFIGDAVMAVFGIPTLHEDDALRAVRAASELPVAVGPELPIRVGVATGEVLAGDPTDRQTFATGETVVTAERLEKAAPPGEVLIDGVTHRLVADAVEAERVEPVAAKGKAEPVEAWRLLGVRVGAVGVARRFDTPLVNRRADLDALRDAFATAVAERRCRLLALLGAAGIGKSRLVREFLSETGPRATVRVGSCPPYGDGVTFWPVADVLPDETLEGTTDEIFWRVRKQFEELARERPLVLCFEDVHWGEPTFLNLLDYLQGWIADAPVLIVCLARPELLGSRPEWTVAARTLEPLSTEEAENLLDLLGAPPEARTRIAAAAEGNPLFAEQMAAMAADTGSEFVVPESIRVLLASRLDRLSREERAVVERAAVIGREFPLRAVAALMPEETRPEVANHLLSLVRKDLVEPHSLAFANEDGFRFRHGLIREAAYDSMPKALRAELHERYANWFERYSGEDVVGGYHLEQAFRLREQLGERIPELARKAGALLGAAGRRALGRGDLPAAVALLDRAVALADSPRLRIELGTALLRTGHFDRAEPVLERAAEAAAEQGDRAGELRALVERQFLRSFVSPSRAATENASVARAAIAELDTLGDELALAKAWWLLSETAVIAGHWAERAEALELALEHAARAPNARHERSSIAALLAQALYYGPTSAGEGARRCRAFLDDAPADGTLRAGAGCILAGFLAMQGRFDEARALYAEARALADELGLAFRRATTAPIGAEIEALGGDAEAAERLLREGYATLEAMGERGVRSTLAACLADLLADAGRDDDAERFAGIAAELAEAEDVATHVLARAASARVAARRGERDRAARLAADALALAERTDSPQLRTAALHACAEAAKDRRTARAWRARALQVFKEKGNRVAADRLAAALKEDAAR